MSAPMTPQTKTPTERVEQLIALTERLTQLIAVQAQAFETRRPHEAATTMQDVARLTNAYRDEVQRARTMPQLFAAAPAPLRAKLQRATEAFDAVLARQGRALHGAKTVTEGLVHAVAEEITRQRTSNAGYGPNGAKYRPDAARAVTLNKRA